MESFLQELETILPEIRPGTLSADTVFRQLPVWDSLAALTVLAAVNACYGVQVSADELKKCTTIGDIEVLASQKQRGQQV